MPERNCRFELRLSRTELYELTKKSRKAGVTASAFIRQAVNGAEVKPLPDAEVGALIRGIYNSGSSLDRLIKICAAQGINIPELRLAVQESRAAARAVIDAYK